MNKPIAINVLSIFAVVVIILGSFGQIAAAEALSDTDYILYDLSELGISVPMPTDYYVFTLGMPSDSPTLKAFGITPAEVDAVLMRNNSLLDAVSPNGKKEIFVMGYDSTNINFSQMDEIAIESYEYSLKDLFEQIGDTVSSMDRYSTGDAVYIRFWKNSPNNSVYSLQYYTIYNHKAISITLTKRSGALDETEENLIAEIADNIVTMSNMK